MISSVGERLVSSAKWSIASDVIVVLASAGSTLVAARWLTTAELGLVATVLLLIALLETITASGLEQALVQRRSLTDETYDTAWTWHVFRGITIGLVVFLGSGLLADFYETPRLASLASALALQPILRGASNMRVVIRLRELDFRAVFVMNVAPAITALALTAWLTWWRRDAWALVVALLGEHGLRTLLSFVLLRSKPKFRIRWEELKPLLGYGRWMTGLSILVYVTTRGDDLFVSKYFGAAELAIYQLAFGIANVPVTGISRVIGRVALPAFARLSTERERLRIAFMEVLQLTTFAGFLAGVALYFAFPFLPAIVGQQWQSAVQIGRVLALGGAVRALMNTGGPLFQGTGRPELDFRMNVPRLLVLVALLGPFAAWLGLIGVSWASFASVCALAPAWWLGVRLQTALTPGQILSALARPLAAAAMTAAVLATVGWAMPPDLGGFALFVLLGVGITYGLLRMTEFFTGISLLPSLNKLRAL